MHRKKEYDREEMAAKLLEWAKKDTSINFNGFCAQELIPPQNISKWKHENECFHEAYDITRSILATRREHGLNAGTVHVKTYDLNAGVYDYFLKEESRDEKKFDASLKLDDSKDDGAERIANAIEKLANKKEAS